MPVYINGQSLDKEIQNKIQKTMEGLGVTPNHLENFVNIQTKLQLSEVNNAILDLQLGQLDLEFKAEVSILDQHYNEYINNKLNE